MKFENITETVKKYINRNKVKGWVDICFKYKRYIGGVMLFALMVLILVQCAGPENRTTGKQDLTATETTDGFKVDKKFEKNAHDDVNELISNYFTACAAGDLDTLEKLAYPMSDNEKSYIGVFSQYIESYDDILVYTKKGLCDGDYLVSVYYNMKFYGVDTSAPGLDFFYVQTDKDEKVYINNLYSSYNLNRTENDLDANVYSAILKYEEQSDSVKLREDVEEKYQDAVASDANLAAMISTTIPNAMSEWMQSVSDVNSGDSTEAVTEEATETTDGKTDKSEKTTKKKSEKSDSKTDKTTDESTDKTTDETTDADTAEETKEVKIEVTENNVNVRSSASKKGKVIGKAYDGDYFTKTGEEDDWVQIDYDGKTGYIKSDFVKAYNE